MDATARKLSPEDEVRAFLDGYFAAVRAGDLGRIVAHHASDVVAYDAIAQLEFVGLDAYKAHWKSCLEMYRNMTFEPRTPIVAACGDVAFGHWLACCGGTGADGKESSGWVRATFGARKVDGGWRIVHEHYSLPFDPTSGKALTDLVPAV